MTTVRKKALSLLLGVLLLCSVFLASSGSGLAEADPETGEEMVLREGAPQTDDADEPDDSDGSTQAKPEKEGVGETAAGIIPSDWQAAAQDGGLKLYVDKKTGQFAVENAAGRIWWSVPYDAGEDPLAKGKNKMNQQSLMIIKYGNPDTNTLDTVSSQAGSVQKKGMSIQNIDKGVRITYDFTGPQIRIPLEIVLKEDRVSVTVVTEDIEEYGEDYLYEIQLLPSMGAGSTADEGWLFVPDGSGALIRFNNGRQNLSSYSAMVYGKDPNASIIRKIEVTESVRLPVFGVKNGEGAMLGVIAENDGLAYLEASVSGKNSSYNTVYSRFALRKTDTYVMGQSTGNSRTVTLYSTAPLPTAPIQVDYYFLEGEEADLPGMAAVYREVLKAGGMKDFAGDYHTPPVYIDVLGGVYKEKPVLGIPSMSVLPVTTFEDCAEMLAELKKKGMEQLVVRYQNWSSDLLRGKVSDSATPDGKLGGRSGLKKLLADQSIQVYLDGDFTYVSKWQLGYGKSGYAAKSISNIPTTLYEHDIATYFSDDRFPQKWLLSPFKLNKVGEKYLASYAKLNNPYLSTGQTAALLYADYGYREYNRSDSKDAVTALYDRFVEEGLRLMVSGGNSYAAVYAEHILDAPVASSRYDILDESVPFYQMVFHGSKLLGSEAINNAANPQTALLRAVQGGSLLHYTFIDPDGKESLLNTVYDNLFCADYTLYANQAAEQYQALKPLYSRIIGQTITGYRQLADGVTLTVYADGTEVAVNFTEEPFVYRDEEVGASGYRYWLS